MVTKNVYRQFVRKWNTSEGRYLSPRGRGAGAGGRVSIGGFWLCREKNDLTPTEGSLIFFWFSLIGSPFYKGHCCPRNPYHQPKKNPPISPPPPPRQWIMTGSKVQECKPSHFCAVLRLKACARKIFFLSKNQRAWTTISLYGIWLFHYMVTPNENCLSIVSKHKRQHRSEVVSD